MLNRKLKAKKIKHRRINDDTICVSYIHTNVSQTLQVRMLTKPEKIVVPAPPKQPPQSKSEFAPPLTFPQTSIVIAVPPSRSKHKAAMRATPITQPSQNRKDRHHRLLNRTSLWHRINFAPQICQQTVHHQDKRDVKCRKISKSRTSLVFQQSRILLIEIKKPDHQTSKWRLVHQISGTLRNITSLQTMKVQKPA